MRRLLGNFLVYTLLSIGAVVMLMPFAWMVSTSFKTRSEVERWPPIWTSKNFSRTWHLKTSVSRGSVGGLDWKGLTLREALVLVQREAEQNVLRILIDDDPVYRGTLTVSFPPNAKLLSGRLDAASFEKFLEELRELTTQKDVLQLIDETSDAETFFSRFFAMYLHGTNALLDRRNYVELVENAANSSLQQIEVLSRYTTRVPEEYRDEFSRFMESVRKACTDVVSSVTIFKKGRTSILDSNEVKNLTHVLKDWIAQLDTGKLSESLKDNPVIRLYEQRVLASAKNVLNVLETYSFVNDYFQSVQTQPVGSAIVKFRFMNEKERKNELLVMLDRLNIPDELKKIAVEELNYSLNGLAERVEKRVDEKLYSELETQHLDNVRLYVQQMKQLASQLLNLLNPRNVRIKYFEDLDQLKVWLQSEGSSAAWVILGKIEQLSSFLEKDEFFKILLKVSDEVESVSQIRSALARVQSLMKIVQAPDFVKEVRLKQNQTIEFVLDDVHPVYLEDERYAVRVDYSSREVLGNIFHNYVAAWKSAPFGIYYVNTVFVSTVTTIAEVVLCAMAAYAFALMNFPGKNLIFGLFLSTMMIPGEVLLVPNFITISKLGWIDTYYALIIPWIVSVFAIFLLRQHFLTLPRELQDAAKIDGCSHWRFLWTVVVPLSKPAIVTSALLKFVGSWNAFLWVLIVTNKDRFRTLPVGLQTFSTDVGTVYNMLMAAATFSILPILILFLFTQRYFVQGIARTGLK
ncbi:MAG: ABC transporter permease subunit [Thermotoga caldifontis]|uniref:carbohydrate ABC transporter permease n=1 Tax=Thermotoga caldifontis TaxID=1508419 RepID=UPI003C7A0C21